MSPAAEREGGFERYCIHMEAARRDGRPFTDVALAVKRGGKWKPVRERPLARIQAGLEYGMCAAKPCKHNEKCSYAHSDAEHMWWNQLQRRNLCDNPRAMFDLLDEEDAAAQRSQAQAQGGQAQQKLQMLQEQQQQGNASEDPVDQLASLFPDKDRAFLKAILDGKKGNVAAAVLTLSGTAPASEAHPNPKTSAAAGPSISISVPGRAAGMVVPLPASVADDPVLRRAAAAAFYLHGPGGAGGAAKTTGSSDDNDAYHLQRMAPKPPEIHAASEFPSLASSVSQPPPPNPLPKWGGAIDTAPRYTLNTERIIPGGAAPSAPGSSSNSSNSNSNSNSNSHAVFVSLPPQLGSESEFPSLGWGAPDGAGSFRPVAPGHDSADQLLASLTLADKLRLDRLCDELYWIKPQDVAAELLQTPGMKSDDAERALTSKFGGPTPDQVARREKELEAKARAAERERAQKLRQQRAARAGKAASAASHGGQMPWLQTGLGVSALYQRLRSEARAQALLRNQALMQATKAYQSGDTKLAAQLSKQGQIANTKMKELHKEASDEIFRLRNPPETMFANDGIAVVDLHGLHAAEAEELLPDFLQRCREIGAERVRIVTGTGHHAVSGTITGDSKLEKVVKDSLVNAGLDFWVLTDANGHGGQFAVNL
jgi:hypothetical protein